MGEENKEIRGIGKRRGREKGGKRGEVKEVKERPVVQLLTALQLRNTSQILDYV